MPARRGGLPRIGAHVSVAGGLLRSLEKARRIGAEVLQVFPSNPRQWRRPGYGAEELHAYRESLARGGFPLFVHTIYLINLASPDRALRERSAGALADAWIFGARTGARGVVTHVGSHRGEGVAAAVGRVAETVGEAEARLREGVGGRSRAPALLLEVSAGAAGSVGGSPEELGRLLEVLPAGCGVCLDTAHLFAAGYPIQEREGLDAFLEELQRRVGLERLGLVHLNDSATDLGSRRDRHENLGEGRIGSRGLASWLRHPALRGVPVVLETPGFDQQGPDRRNLQRAKRWRAEREPG